MLTLALDDPRWTELVERSEAAHPFHHPAWAGVLARSYGLRPFVLALPGDDGRLAGGLPVLEVRSPLGARRWVSLPFTDYGPPLASAGLGDEALVAGLEAARTAAGIKELEVRGELAGAHPAGNAVLHPLTLTGDPDAVLRTFSRSQVQRNVRKAEAAGLTLRRGESASDLDQTFYELHLRTRRRLGVPVQPRRFFSLLWQRMLARGLGFVSLVYAGGEPVAGAVFLAWNGSITYKFGASEPGAWNLRPNHRIFWDAIRWGCESGYRSFDFGRSDLEDEGLRAFKSSWGTTEQPLRYSALADRPSSASLGRLGRLTRPALRRSPLWVSRVLGGVLYRYAA